MIDMLYFFSNENLTRKPKDASPYLWMASLVNPLAYTSVPHVVDLNWACASMELAKCPTTLATTSQANPWALKLKDMGAGFDPRMCAQVTRSFNKVPLGPTTHLITTSR
jgi:hypothetical protein